MKKYELKNLDCAHCAAKIEENVGRLAEVEAVSVNFATQSMKIQTLDMEKVLSVIKDVEPQVQVIATEPSSTKNRVEKFKLKNLDCAHCAATIETALKNMDTVEAVSINFATQSLQLQAGDVAAVIQKIEEVEPSVKVILPQKGEEETSSNRLKKDVLNLIFCFFALFIGIFFQDALHNSYQEIPEYLLFGGLFLWTGHSVLLKAFKNLAKGKIFDENFLMSIATLGAVFIHALPEAAGVMIFYRIGELLEQFAVNKSRKSIKALLAIKPDTAHLKVEGGIETVPPETVKVGAEIIVKPGERVPLDGTVLSGESQTDTSALTGESVPVKMKAGDSILAGMICKTGTLTLKVTKTFEDSSISRILEMVENALQRKSKTDRFITTFAKYYTPAIVVFSTLTAVIPPFVLGVGDFKDWLYRSLVILVISCPCALVISIPLGYFGGLGRSSHEGILIKGSNYLDILPKVKTFIFDKTGTLTKGVFKVTDIQVRNGYQKNDLLRFSAYAEAFSNHPIASAIKEAYHQEVEVDKIIKHTEKPGYGVKVTLDEGDILIGNDKFLHLEEIEHQDCELEKTAIYVVVNRKYAGYIVISDEEKEDTLAAIQALRRLGVSKTVMLTGDNQQVAEYYRNKIGIDEMHAELLPEDKVKVLEDYQQTTPGRVAFVGDGINDAPVIARADLGIAMGKAGTDAAIETADIVLMTDHLSKLPEAITISQKTKRIIWQNIFGALGIKILFVAFGAFGLASMWEAVFADVGVTLLAVLNSLRVLKKG